MGINVDFLEFDREISPKNTMTFQLGVGRNTDDVWRNEEYIRPHGKKEKYRAFPIVKAVYVIF